MMDEADPRLGPARRTVVLIVRLWSEPVDGGPAVVRGTAAELGGAALGAFASMPSLVDLLQRYLTGDPNG